MLGSGGRKDGWVARGGVQGWEGIGWVGGGGGSPAARVQSKAFDTIARRLQKMRRGGGVGESWRSEGEAGRGCLFLADQIEQESQHLGDIPLYEVSGLGRFFRVHLCFGGEGSLFSFGNPPGDGRRSDGREFC